jgi:hypothetical protein
MDSQTPAPSVVKRPCWPGYLLGGYAAACGAMALASMKVSPPGWAVFTHPFLGLVGLAGGLLLLCGDPWWRPLLRFWTFAQMAVVIVDPSGELTRQPGLWLAFTNISSSTANDQVVTLQGYGVNLAGLVLFGLAQWIITRRWYLVMPGQPWQFQVLRLVRLLFLAASLVLVGYVAWTHAPLVLEKEPLMIISCPPPGAEVFLADERLGFTPLVITHDKMVAWGLSKAEGPPRCEVRRTELDDGLRLQGNRGATNLLLKPPWWCERSFETYPSEWGPRGIIINDLETSNRCTVRLIAEAKPGVVLGVSDLSPAVCKPGQPVEFTITKRCNPPDRRAPANTHPSSGVHAALSVTFMRGSAHSSKEVPLPAEWAVNVVGESLQQTVKVPAPEIAGKYTVRVAYQLFGSTNSRTRVDAGWARSYGYLEVK